MSASNAYDVVRYPNRSYAQTHPQRLGAIGMLRGLSPRPPSASRVLEIGCGDGANLAAMAASLPASEFVGIDASPAAVDAATKCADELGLTNLRFLCARIEELSPEDTGPFDYAIAHGVYSWIPAPAREALLALVSRVLAKDGLAYISYNAYPGCHFREMSRRMMRYHVRHLDDPAEQIGQGRALMQMLTKARKDIRTEAYDAVLSEELAHSIEYNQASFFHDDLAEVNDAFYFHEFLASARSHDLDFASEADLRDMQVSEFGSEITELLREMDRHDEAVKEQYLDFLRGRRFRQTVLRRADAPSLPRLDFSRIDRLWIAGQLEESEAPSDAPSGAICFSGPKGSGLTAVDPALQSTLRIVAAAWPQGVPFSELTIETGIPKDRLTAFLTEAAIGGVVELRMEASPLTRHPTQHPVASLFARWQIRSESIVTTLIHQRVRLEDEASKELLRLLDGSRDMTALALELGRFTDPSKEESLRSEIPVLLEKYARLGLLSR